MGVTSRTSSAPGRPTFTVQRLQVGLLFQRCRSDRSHQPAVSQFLYRNHSTYNYIPSSPIRFSIFQGGSASPAAPPKNLNPPPSTQTFTPLSRPRPHLPSPPSLPSCCSSFWKTSRCSNASASRSKKVVAFPVSVFTSPDQPCARDSERGGPAVETASQSSGI